MATQLSWGILGTGNIARQFCQGVATASRSQLVAVASRQQSSADAFAAQHGIPTAYGSYWKLLNDPQVQAIYLSLPNALHHPWTLAALNAGKHVLCEKPIAMTVAHAAEMFDLAAKKGLLLMEAFMYRCHPQTTGVLEKLRSGAIGELRIIRTSFCFRTRKIEGNVRFSPELGGGVLMDVGCYCIDFARVCAGALPTEAHVTARKHPTGVDDMAVGHLAFGPDLLASFTCAMDAQADNTATLMGTEGYIEIPIPWKPPAMNAEYRICSGIPPRMDQPASANPVAPPIAADYPTAHSAATSHPAPGIGAPAPAASHSAEHSAASSHQSATGLGASNPAGLHSAEHAVTGATPATIAPTAIAAAGQGTSAPAVPPRQTFFAHAPGSLYGMEADAFAAAVLDGAPLPVTRADSLGTMGILQNLREQIHGPWTHTLTLEQDA